MIRKPMMRREVEVLPEKDPASVVPCRGLCLVRLKAVDDKTASGIYLLDEYQGRKKVIDGELVAVGVGAPPDVSAIPPMTPVVLHGHTRASYRFQWEGRVYGVYVAEDLMAVQEVAA